MENRNKYYLEILIADETNDLIKKMDFFNSITNCLFEISNNPFEKKIKIKYHQQILESKAYRMAFTNNTLMNIIKGNQVNILGQNLTITDVDSLFSITRMQIEAFVILFYLIFDEADDQTKDFRLNIYKLHALQKQSSLRLSNDFVDTEKQLEKIHREISEVIEANQKSPEFISAPQNKKKEYLKPNYARLFKSDELFKRSGLQSSRVDIIWSIYSNYAHSEYISDRQYYYRVQNPKTIPNEISLILYINKMISSKLILLLKDLYPENSVKYDSFDTRNKVCIETWAKM